MARSSVSGSRALLKRFVPYFRPHARTMIFDLCCAALTTICDLVLPLIVRYITGTALNGGELLLSTILRLGALYTALRIIDAAANYYMQSVGHIMASKIEADMRRDLFGHLQELSHSFYDNTRIGQLMSRLTTDLNDITEFAHHFPEEMFIAFLKITISFAILAQTDLLLTIAIFVSIPLMVLFSRFFSKKMRAAFQDSRKQLGVLNSSIEDSLSGIRVVKSFANEDVENEKFARGNLRFLEIKKRMYRSMAGFHSVPRLFDGLMYILCVVLGSIAMIHGSIQAPDLVAYLLYVTMLLAAIRRMVEFTEQFQRGITGIERFTEIMDEPVEIRDNEDAPALHEVRGDILFRDVTFSYSDGGVDVLSHIDLHITPGMNVALVGPSGSGKSTLCSLIPRFYDVTSGAVEIDGHDVRNVQLKSLREQIGTVQQDVYLFAGSIADNIEYGKPGAALEEIVAAAKLAGAHEFISAMEQGYDTYVGEHGARLSGGQKQRIAIARVFLKNPPILILDEATSALDNESEHLVQRSIERLMKGRTTFSIAHRLTTIKNADLILVLTENGIEEQGTHRELMAKGGVYAQLYKMYTDDADAEGKVA